jgi:aldehyde:ferredoxin oxidoreductase
MNAPETLYGYSGSILRVDLTRGAVRKEPLSAELAARFIGGRGFVAKLLWDELPPGIDPFDPENVLIAATGPLTGHLLPSSGKTHFGAKSPATGGYADSNLGGHFGPALKYAGYDALVLTGRAAAPSLLVIDDDRVEIRPAAHGWGRGAISLEAELKRELGAEFQILAIGPAGERRVRFACIGHDFGRQAGRTGIGAVMGSKNLKAVAVRGTGGIPVPDAAALLAAGRQAFAAIAAKPGFTAWTPEGTAGITDWCNRVGVFPTRNFRSSHAPDTSRINGRAVIERLKLTDKGCAGCPIPCGKYGRTQTRLGAAHVEGPEYETIALFGGSCRLPEVEEVAYANHLCDELGLDTISAGAVISWAIECHEKGLLPEARIGRPIAFGDLESVAFLLARIAAREGIGGLLAEGVQRAAAAVGGGSEAFAIHVKGLEWSGYETRNAPAMMLAYMTSDVGAHHARAWVLGHDLAGAWTSVHDLIQSGGGAGRQPRAVVRPECARAVIDSQHVRPLFDALGVCRLPYMELGFETHHYEKLFGLVTGRRLAWEEMLGASERIWNLTRMISAREIPGFGRADDLPPARFYTEPVPDGPNAGCVIAREELERLLDWYYAARGWDANGIPTRETLLRLGLTAEVR